MSCLRSESWRSRVSNLVVGGKRFVLVRALVAYGELCGGCVAKPVIYAELYQRGWCTGCTSRLLGWLDFHWGKISQGLWWSKMAINIWCSGGVLEVS